MTQNPLEFYNFYCVGGSQTQNFVVPRNCRLVGVDFAIEMVGTADGTSALIDIELPGQSTSNASGQNTVVAIVRITISQLSAAEYAYPNLNKFCLLPDPGIPVSRNQAIIYKVAVNGAMTVLRNCIVFIHPN